MLGGGGGGGNCRALASHQEGSNKNSSSIYAKETGISFPWMIHMDLNKLYLFYITLRQLQSNNLLLIA